MTTILYVEDNDDNVFMLKHRLQRRGFEVVIAGDGEAGVALAQRLQPDLVIMDLSLPVLDGWDATRRLKADPATAAIPVIALSSHAMGNERAAALDAGCDEYDSKPVDLKRLLAKILGLLPSAPAP